MESEALDVTPQQREIIERVQRQCESAWASGAAWLACEAVWEAAVELEHLLEQDWLAASRAALRDDDRDHDTREAMRAVGSVPT